MNLPSDRSQLIEERTAKNQFVRFSSLIAAKNKAKNTAMENQKINNGRANARNFFVAAVLVKKLEASH